MTVMGRFHGVKLLILFPVLVFAFPATNVKQTFDPISQREVPSHNVPSQLGRSISIKSYPAPFHSNGPQQLDRRNSDASSFRAKPSSNFAWTPIKLGGWSFHGSFLLDQSLTQSRLEGQSLGVLLDIGSAELYVLFRVLSFIDCTFLTSFQQLGIHNTNWTCYAAARPTS